MNTNAILGFFEDFSGLFLFDIFHLKHEICILQKKSLLMRIFRFDKWPGSEMEFGFLFDLIPLLGTSNQQIFMFFYQILNIIPFLWNFFFFLSNFFQFTSSSKNIFLIQNNLIIFLTLNIWNPYNFANVSNLSKVMLSKLEIVKVYTIRL